MWLVVGLGNPGDRYRDTRHNIGFDVVDRLAERMGVTCDRRRPGALWADGRRRGDRIHLLKPQEFMNRSGLPTRSHMDYFRIPLAQIIVVHDDLGLPFGTIRLKKGGGAGGHNGLRDLDLHLPDPGYARVRFGIGRPQNGQDTAAYVLSRWRQEEAEAIDALIDKSADAVQAIVSRGLPKAMNRYNARPKKKRRRSSEEDEAASAADSAQTASENPNNPQNSNEAPSEAAS